MLQVAQKKVGYPPLRGRAIPLCIAALLATLGLPTLLLTLSNALDEFVPNKQAAESESVKVRTTLEQERARLKQSEQASTLQLQIPPQERERAERLEQDLAAARRDLQTQTALAAKASDEVARLKQGAESGTLELQKSLQQERELAEVLAQELSEARRELDTQHAQAAKAMDEVARVKQASEARTAEFQKSLTREHDQAEALAQDLSAAHAKIYAYEAQASTAHEAVKLNPAESGTAELRQSLQDQRELAERLGQDLAAARRELQTQTALAAKVTEEVARLKQDLALSRSQRGPARADRLELNAAAAKPHKNTTPAPEAATASQTSKPKPFEPRATEPVTAEQKAVRSSQGTSHRNPGDAEVMRLVARASALLGQGDISAARIVLERAAETGSAQASFALAETYDPLMLPKWGTFGTRGDATKARDLYARAQAGGIKEAKERFEALRR